MKQFLVTIDYPSANQENADELAVLLAKIVNGEVVAVVESCPDEEPLYSRGTSNLQRP